MIRTYTILFPANKKNLYRWMGRFILLGSSMLFLGLSDPGQIKYGWPVLGLLLFALDLVSPPVLRVGLMIQVFGWITADQWIMAMILLILFLFHERSIKQQVLRIDQNGLVLSFPWKRQKAWDTVAYIILKDGILTIEYKNGKVFQQAIEKDSVLNEADFNEFCQLQCNA